jgi:hypothetical protein
MKKVTRILPVILLAVGISAYGIDLQSYGFNVTNTQRENNQTVYTLQTRGGFSFTVASSNPLTDSDARILQSSISTLAGWKLLKIAQAKVVFNDSRVNILVLPSSFVYKNVNLADYMPSGMQFYYVKYLQYDFRMLKDNLFLRLKGEVYSENQFADRLYAAVENPVLFLQTNNPAYLLRQIKDLTQKIERLTLQLEDSRKAANAAEAKLTEKIDSLAKQGQDLVARQEVFNAKQAAVNTKQISVNAKQGAVNTKQASVNAKQAAVNTDIQVQLANIKAQNKSMADELDRVRYSLLAFNNRGFFGRIYPLDKRAIARVVGMKEADPSLTKDQVMTKLHAAGIKMSGKEVSLVFEVYFNEFK